MKINTAKTPILTNIKQNQQFKIKASAKAFKILSDGLYSNKIEAIVRELCCNAYDSHKEAGQLKPFEVFLPNAFEPMFIVKDEGIGIHPDSIVDIYCTYFNSTKDETNEYIGALGLGSKSPFSKVDSFIVVNTYNGLEYTYNIFLNEIGEPSLSLMGKPKETTNHNGVEVKVPVAESDFYDYERQVENVLYYFDSQPTVYKNGCEYAINSIYENLEPFTDSIYTDKNISWNGQYHALMGNIRYRIELSELGYPAEIIEVLNKFEKKVYIKFNLGDLDITPNREALSYDNNTKENIKLRINEYLELVEKDFKDRYAEFNNNVRDAISFYRNNKFLCNYFGLTYKNKELKFYSNEKISFSDFNVKAFKKNSYNELAAARLYDNYGSEIQLDYLVIKDKALFAENNSRLRIIVNGYMNDNYPINEARKGNFIVCMYDKKSSVSLEEQKKEFIEFCEEREIEVIDINDIKDNYTKNAGLDSSVYVYDYYFDRKIELDELEDIIEQDDEVFYINRIKGYIQTSEYLVSKNTLKKLVDDKPIITINASTKKRILKAYPEIKHISEIHSKIIEYQEEAILEELNDIDMFKRFFEEFDESTVFKAFKKLNKKMFDLLYGSGKHTFLSKYLKLHGWDGKKSTIKSYFCARTYSLDDKIQNIKKMNENFGVKYSDEIKKIVEKYDTFNNLMEYSPPLFNVFKKDYILNNPKSTELLTVLKYLNMKKEAK